MEVSKKFVVEGNDKVVGIRIAHGYKGMGGSNSSSFQEKSNEVSIYTLEELKTCRSLWAYNMELYALKNDILYIRYTNENGEVYESKLSSDEPGAIFLGDNVSYDTYSAIKVSLILK